MDTKGSGRVMALDGVRAIAAFCVLVDHLFPHDTIIWRMFSYGRFGVDAFFILSGYLIIDILLSGRAQIEQGVSVGRVWSDFFARRALRILPIYFGIILVFVAAKYAPVTSVALWHFTFASNIGASLYQIDFSNLGHFWSICVEEQFYLVVPLAILFFSAQRSFRIIYTVVAFCLLAKVLLSIFVAPHNPYIVARLPITNVECLTYGALIAYATRVADARAMLLSLVKWATVPAIVVVAAISCYRFAFGDAGWVIAPRQAVQDLAYACAFGPLILMAVERRLPPIINRLLTLQTITYLGRISYGTYAIHFAMIPFYGYFLSPMHVQAGGYKAFVIECLIAYAMASLSWFALERPILGLKRHFVPAKAQNYATAGAVNVPPL